MSTHAITHISTPTNPIPTASTEGRFSKGTVAIAAAVAIITGIALAIFEVISWTVLASAGASLATCYIISLAMKQSDSTISPIGSTPRSSTPTVPETGPHTLSTPVNLTPPLSTSLIPPILEQDNSTHSTSPQLPTSTNAQPAHNARRKLFGRSASSSAISSSQTQTPVEELRVMITQVQQSPARLQKNLTAVARDDSPSGESRDSSPTLLRLSDSNLFSTTQTSSSASSTPQDSLSLQFPSESSPPSSLREGNSETTQEKTRTTREIGTVQFSLRDSFRSPQHSSTASQPSELVFWRREMDTLYSEHKNLIAEILAFIEGNTRTPERCYELKVSLTTQARVIAEKLSDKRLHLSATNFRVFTGELTNRVRRIIELLEAI